MNWEGFAYAAGAAVGHSCIDVSRKMAAKHFSPMELIALVGLLDAFLLCSLLWMLGSNSNERIGSMPINALWETRDQNLLRIVVISAGLKVMAGYMYQRALQVSPMSVTVPYLAFTPVLLVFTSYFLMHEIPSARGLLGVVVVTVGGYMLVVDKEKDKKIRDLLLVNGDDPSLPQVGGVGGGGDSFNVSWDASAKKAYSFRSLSHWVFSSHIFEPILALRREEGSLLMLGVAGVFSISNSLDKMGTHLSPSSVSFAAVQRVIMAIPVVFYLILVSPRSFKHLLRWFPGFLIISFFEIVAFICYLKSLESLLVSYAIAAKRSNVLLSVIVGRVVFKEKIWKKLPFVILMVVGMILIILA
uniref:EamA domain-containing protein n=1 Tax=Araucaria cunninghamii TaxID=56994 RepID=A0A0D6QYV4_ARACU